ADQARARLAVGDAIDAIGPPAALEGLDGQAGFLVIGAAGLQAVAQPVQARAQDDDAQPLVARRQRPAQGGDASGRGVEPQAVPGLGQTLPRKQLAGILLALGRHVGVADDAGVGDGPAGADVADQRDQRLDLRRGEQAIAELMARIDDFDADRGGVDVGLALPGAAPGVPGAALLRHQAQDRAVLVDDVVGRDLGLGIAKAGHGLLGRRHAGIVQHQHVRRAASGVEVRGRRVSEGYHGREIMRADQRPSLSQPYVTQVSPTFLASITPSSRRRRAVMARRARRAKPATKTRTPPTTAIRATAAAVNTANSAPTATARAVSIRPAAQKKGASRPEPGRRRALKPSGPIGSELIMNSKPLSASG